jgi:lipid-A-disaccharide synthase
VTVLLVAGEASGDRFAAGVARALGTRCFGMGGPASVAAGVDVLAHIERITAMGVGPVLARLPALLAAHRALTRAVRERRPRAAVLVGFTEYCARIGRWLRARRVRVLWAMAPQVWAWRSGRVRTLARSLDRLAVVLPFEEALWRRAGTDAVYVGHPALDMEALDRATARCELGIDERAPCIALLPGSRPHEVRAHTAVMLAAVAKVGAEARLLLSAALDERTRHFVCGLAAKAAVPVVHTDALRGAAPWLRAFDASIAASGTATLECALAGAPPVVVYRMAAPTFLLARLLVKGPYVALPNVLLGDAVYPELLQGGATAPRVARATSDVLSRRGDFERRAQDLARMLAYRGNLVGQTSSERAASLLSPWIEADCA